MHEAHLQPAVAHLVTDKWPRQTTKQTHKATGHVTQDKLRTVTHDVTLSGSRAELTQPVPRLDPHSTCHTKEPKDTETRESPLASRGA